MITVQWYKTNRSLLLENKQWSRLSADGKLAPSERAGHSCVMHEGIIYIWGGQKEGRYLNDLFLFNINPSKSQTHVFFINTKLFL